MEIPLQSKQLYYSSLEYKSHCFIEYALSSKLAALKPNREGKIVSNKCMQFRIKQYSRENKIEDKLKIIDNKVGDIIEKTNEVNKIQEKIKFSTKIVMFF